QGHRLLPLPPYSPEYNPIEKIWAHIKKTPQKSIAKLRYFS
ncbi:transposase, partial [Streptococcus suis]